MSNYDDIILELKDFARSFNMSYINSFAIDNQSGREAAFASNIVGTLNHKKHLLIYLSKMHRKDLEDCLRTHGDKYVRGFESTKKSPDEIKDFHDKITDILDFVAKSEPDSSLTNQELDLIGERLYKILKNAQLLFAEQSHNTQAKDSMQALAIALDCYTLEYDEQNALYEKLLQVKELWEITNTEAASAQSVKYKFHYDPMSRIKLQEIDDKDGAFEKIVVLLTGKMSTLDTLSDEQIIHLYDRLKNLEWTSPSIPLLLNRIHDEAQFRYSYNRLTDSGYDLLNRFQSFDALMHQVDNLEFSIVESYLINNTNFIKDTLSSLFKHVDNIRGLALSKDKNLGAIFKKIETKIHHLSGSEQESAKSALTSVRGKLGNTLEPHIQKRYVDLDKFAKLTIQNRYNDLFEKLDLIVEEKEGYIEYIQELFVKKLTRDFYLPNLSNSIEKLRKMAEYKVEVSRLLSQLHLADIFLHKGLLNKIPSLDFKHVSLDSDIKSSTDYVNKLTTEIVTKCSAFQLEVLYKPLLKSEILTEIQMHLKEEISNQIHQRTSVGKMIFSIVSGKKKEYDQLKTIKKNIKKKPSKNQEKISQ